MLLQLLIATVMVLLTVTMHGAGLAVFGRVLRVEQLQEVQRHTPPLSPRTLVFTLGLVIGLFALHGLEIWTYAALYLGLGAVKDLATGVYFSTITYGGIG